MRELSVEQMAQVEGGYHVLCGVGLSILAESIGAGNKYGALLGAELVLAYC
jgi:hypothetical protein